jgi:hypothetical protein
MADSMMGGITSVFCGNNDQNQIIRDENARVAACVSEEANAAAQVLL